MQSFERQDQRMELIKQRAVTYLKKKLTSKEIHEDMSTTLGESAPSYT